MSQPITKQALTQTKISSKEALQYWEGVWFAQFHALRYGLPEIEEEVTGGGSAMLLKAVKPEGRTFKVLRPGREPFVRNVKATAERNEIQDWCEQVEDAEREFGRVTRGEKIETVRRAAIPGERDLFDALVRAKTAAQVRRICKRSKFWLKFRLDFPGGRFFEDFSACPRLLYDKAEEFCRAKLDPRYPARDARPSGDDRRIEYFARVMAGLSLLPKPYKPSYAVDILRKKKHKRGCPCGRCRLPLPAGL